MGADRQRTRGTGRSADRRRRSRRRVSVEARRGRRGRRRRSRAPDRARRAREPGAFAAAATWRRNEPGPYANANGASTGTESTGVPSSRWQGTIITIGRRRRRRTASSAAGERAGRRGRRRHATEAAVARPTRAGGGGAVERCRDRRSRASPWRVAPRRAPRARRHDDDRARPGRGDHGRPCAPRARPARRRRARAARRALPDRERPDRDHDPAAGRVRDAVEGTMVCVCYRPWTPVYSTREGRCSTPLALRAAVDDRGRRADPGHGPVILASNHISYLDPLALAYLADRRGRRVRFLAKAELFDKGGLGPLLRAAHQIPVHRGTTDAAARRSTRRSTRSGAASASRCSPRGRSRSTSSRWPASRGRRGSRRRAACRSLPVGLWGMHRIMFKGRKPHWRTGVAEVGVVGPPLTIGPDEDVHDATDRIMGAICRRSPGPARSTRSRPEPDDDGWWVRAPETAGGCAARRRRETRDGRGHRRGLVGHHGGRDRRRQRADDALGARPRRSPRRSTSGTRTPTTSPTSRSRPRCTPPAIWPTRAPAPTSS